MFKPFGKKLKRRDDLIIDFGMHHGLDSKFYLEKGFKVVGVEANPLMVAKASSDLREFVDSGQLIIEAVGIGRDRGRFPFYRSLENDEWSTFDLDRTKDRGEFEEVLVECVTAADIFRKHGIPYYAKIDIEGLDFVVVEALRDLGVQPKFLSIENGPREILAGLYEAGWRKFKFVDMSQIWQISLPNPPLEGRYVVHQFAACTSGPFGEEVPGEWIDYDAAMVYFVSEIEPQLDVRNGRWFDIHCQA